MSVCLLLATALNVAHLVASRLNRILHEGGLIEIFSRKTNLVFKDRKTFLN